MKLVPTKEKVQIKLFVWAGDEMIPHTSKMAGKWGWDFECSNQLLRIGIGILLHHWSRLLGLLILATWKLWQKKIHSIVSMQRTFIQLSDSVVPTVLPPMEGACDYLPD